MIPFRAGDPVRVEGDTWFGGAVGVIVQSYPESGTLMVKLERWSDGGRKVLMEPATLPFAPSELVATSCQHPQISESILRGWLVRQHWDATPPSCPDCNSTLYPALLDDNSLRIYVDEPPGAGEDYWGRPDPISHPEAWTE